MWPLSSYGAAKAEPTLIANLDESPEELRCKAVQALKSGNVQDYVRSLPLIILALHALTYA